MLLSLTSGWTSRVRRHGLFVVFGAAGWGLAVAAAVRLDNVWLVLLCLAFAGAGDMPSGLGRSTIWNQTIPDGLRARLAGIEVLSKASARNWARCGSARWRAGRGRGPRSGAGVRRAWCRWECRRRCCRSW